MEIGNDRSFKTVVLCLLLDLVIRKSFRTDNHWDRKSHTWWRTMTILLSRIERAESLTFHEFHTEKETEAFGTKHETDRLLQTEEEDNDDVM